MPKVSRSLLFSVGTVGLLFLAWVLLSLSANRTGDFLTKDREEFDRLNALASNGDLVATRRLYEMVRQARKGDSPEGAEIQWLQMLALQGDPDAIESYAKYLNGLDANERRRMRAWITAFVGADPLVKQRLLRLIVQ